MRLPPLAAVLMLLLPLAAARAADDAETAAIRQTALDYIEGWYSGDAERMERSLHPDLAKRSVRTGPDGKSTLAPITARGLVDATRSGAGKATPEAKRQRDVTVLDVFGRTAMVKVVAADWVDYMHVAKVDGRWVIVNVLWEPKPRATKTAAAP